MAGPDFLSQLPSLEELLEQPRVKAAVERLNQSTAATRVRTALNGLGAEVARRAEELQSMAPTDLLDKLVRRISEPSMAVASPAINATGQLFGGPWLGTPLAAAAIEAAHTVAAGFRIDRSGSATAVVGLLGCESAAVFSSPIAATSVALESLAGGGTLVVNRSDMSELAPGVRLDAVCRRAGVTLCEVGATDTATLADYESAIEAIQSEGASRIVVFKRLGETLPVDQAFSLADLVGLAHRHGVVCLVDAGVARPLDETPSYGSAHVSVQAAIKDGADAVLVSSTGRLGGPVAGLLVGKSGSVQIAADSPAAKADRFEPAIDAALAATLALFRQPDTLRFTHPLYQLLDTPIENLRSRAERLAPQIASGDEVAIATALEAPAGESASGLPSWMIRVTPSGEVKTFVEALAKRYPDFQPRVDDQHVTIDLRSVFPGQDRAIVAAFLPSHSADNSVNLA